MYYWIDKDSESDNVVVLNEHSLFVGSCDQESIDQVDIQLAGKQSPIEVLGSDGLTVIPFSQIQNITSRNTDDDVEVKYKAQKEIEDKTVYFANKDEKRSFINTITPLVPDHLEKTETTQSALKAAISPLISLLLSVVLIYLFFDKFRWTALILGGLWAAGSLYMLSMRVSHPPTITRWFIRGRYARKMWSGIKTAFSYVFLALIMVGVYSRFPDSYGTKSLYEQMQHEELNAEDVAKYIERGADINYVDEYGDTPLSSALSWSEDELAIALIEAGADLSADDNGQRPLEQAIYNGGSIEVIETMLKQGASLDFKIDGISPLEYAKQAEQRDLVKLLTQYQRH